mmetsp:Transcript_64739/g.121334  ORF Transcript_64739/g.121334 Transcript_64739/m.121334 type:complete len:310 (+) Transcript_64739:332-1261(+)
MRRQQAFAGGTSATGRGEGWWMLELDSQGKLFPPLVMPEHLITSSSKRRHRTTDDDQAGNGNGGSSKEGGSDNEGNEEEDDDGAAAAALHAAGFTTAAAARVKKSSKNKNKNYKNKNTQNGLGSADGVRLNPFTAASLNLNFNLKQQHEQGSLRHGGDNPFNQLRMDSGSSFGGGGVLSSKEKRELAIAAALREAREDLAQRLLHTEGFTMLGSFEDWQGLGGEAVAVRRHLHLPRPLLFCTLPFVADHSFRQLLRRASGVSDWRHDENDGAHWSEGSGTHIAGRVCAPVYEARREEGGEQHGRGGRRR